MQYVRKFVIFKKLTVMIGVALFVSPFFTSVHAQNSNNQARTLLEIQALRQEIAQLRDMVERQQYELRKLQRAQQGPDAVRRPLPRTLGQQPDFPPADQYSDVPDQGAVSPTANDAVYQTTPGSNVESPNTYGREPGTAPNLGAAVDSTIITAPPIDRDSQQSSSGYPPVVDRSIGRPVDSQDSSIPLGSAVTSGSSSVALDRLPSNLPSQGDLRPGGWVAGTGVAELPQPAQTTPSTGVISVPSGVAQPIGQQPALGNDSAGRAAGASSQAGADGSGGAEGSEVAIAAVIAEKDFYQQGFDLLKQSKHDEAVAIFKQQIVSYPQGDYADDAYYWIAESMYVNRKLDISKENFKAIIQNYQQSPRLPDAMLKTAYIEQEQGNVIEARILLQEIVQFHPRSNAAISAKNRLAEIK